MRGCGGGWSNVQGSGSASGGGIHFAFGSLVGYRLSLSVDHNRIDSRDHKASSTSVFASVPLTTAMEHGSWILRSNKQRTDIRLYDPGSSKVDT